MILYLWLAAPGMTTKLDFTLLQALPFVLMNFMIHVFQMNYRAVVQTGTFVRANKLKTFQFVQTEVPTYQVK